MSTTATPTALPSALLRRPAPSVKPAAPPRDLLVHIVGELAEAAHASVEAATQRAALSVVIAQGYGSPKVLATLWLGDGVDAILDAEYTATQMQAGDVVRIEGHGLRMRYHHGALALTLGTVLGIGLAGERSVNAGEHAQERAA